MASTWTPSKVRGPSQAVGVCWCTISHFISFRQTYHEWLCNDTSRRVAIKIFRDKHSKDACRIALWSNSRPRYSLVIKGISSSRVSAETGCKTINFPFLICSGLTVNSNPNAITRANSRAFILVGILSFPFFSAAKTEIALTRLLNGDDRCIGVVYLGT